MKQFLKHIIFINLLLVLSINVLFSANRNSTGSKEITLASESLLPDASFNTTADTSFVNGQSILKVCSNSNAELTFTNTSKTALTNKNYTINWGDGSTSFTDTTWTILSHSYPIGLWTLTYTVTGLNGASVTKKINVYIGSNPAVALGSLGNTDHCSDVPLTFSITGTESNPPGTTYTVTFNDGTTPQVFTHPAPSEITHTFTKSSCDINSYIGKDVYKNSFSATIIAENACGKTAVSLVPIYISTSPVVNFSLPKNISGINTAVNITNTTTGYVNVGANCAIVPKIVWIITPSTGFTLQSGSLGSDFAQDNSNLWQNGSDIISPVFTSPGTYKIKLRVDTKRCGNDQIEKTICVEAPLNPQFTLDVNSGCTPVAVSVVNSTDLSKTCNSSMLWDVAYTAENCGNTPAEWSFTNGSTKASANPSFNFITPGIYKIKLSVSNSCGTFVKEQTVIVKKRPTAVIDLIPDFCGTASFKPKATINNCTLDTGNITYLWSFPGGSPSISNKLDPGVIDYKSTGKYKVSLSVSNECGTVITTSNEFIVQALPYVNDVTSQLMNNNQNTDLINFSGSEQTIYNWTNDNTKIGLPAFGTGDIATFIAQNSEKAILTANIKVTPKNSVTGCVGTSKTFNITVNPSGDVEQPANQTLSNGCLTSQVVFSTGNSGGKTTYQWINNTPEIGLESTGIGNIGSFTAVNNTNEPKVATITVTPVFENSGMFSYGTTKSFTITVIPSAAMKQPSNIEVCNGVTTSDIIFSSQLEIGILKYNWTNDNKSIGLVESGEGTIRAFKAINTDTVPKVAKITVIPVYSFGGAVNTGVPHVFTITVNPAPVFTTQPQSSYICRGGKVTPLKVAYSYGVGKPSYQWYSNTSNSTVGGAIISGANSDIYIPQSDLAGVTYYYCIVNLPKTVCSGITSEVATVAVSDAVIISGDPVRLQNICVGGTIENPLKVEFDGGTGIVSFQWYSNNIDSKTGAKPIQGAISATYTPTAFNNTGRYFYFVEISMSGDGCGSVFSNIAEINVISDPVVSQQPLSSQVICQGTIATDLLVHAVGGLGNYKYQWYENTVNDNSTGKAVPGAVNNIFTPSTALSGTMYYYCVISQENGVNCAVTSSTATVIVNQIPVITRSPASKSLCMGDKPDSLYVLYSYGVGNPTYQWYSNTVNSNTNGSIIANATNSSYYPIAELISKTYYYCELSFSTGGISKIVSDVACITVNPVATISSHNAVICSGTSFTIKPDSQNGDIIPENTNYIWSIPEQIPVNSVSGSNAQPIPVAEISQRLFNLTDSIVTVTYNVVPVTGSCVGESFKVTVNVYPMIKPNTIVNNVSCTGLNDGSIHTKISGGLPFNNIKKYVVSWSGPGGFSSEETEIAGLIPGDYTINITDAGGCPVSYTYKISEPFELTIHTDSKRDINCYKSENGQIQVTISGGTAPYNYSWTKDGLPFATTEDISDLDQGVYSLLVTDAKGCGIKTASYVISEPPALLILLQNKQNNMCFGDSIGTISINVSGGTPFDLSTKLSEYTYFWSGPNGFTSKEKNLSHLATGKYQLTVTDANACSQSIEVEISQPEQLIVSTTVKPMTCYQANDATIILDIKGGVKPYNVKWNNMGSGNFQENLNAGDYIAIVTDANNCQRTIHVNIPEADFMIHPTIRNVSCYGAHDGSINLNISGGLNPVTLVWDDNINAGNQRNQLAPGIYSVTIRDGAPCNIRETFMISEPQQINLTAKTINAFECDNPNSGSIDLTVTGGTPPYHFQWSDGNNSEDLKNIPAGRYSLIVTDSKGCSQSAQFEIIRQAPLTVSLNSQNVMSFSDNKLAKRFIANVSGGFAPYQLHWNKGVVEGQNNEIMETTQSTIVDLQVTDSIGCTLNYSFNVIVAEIGISYDAIDCSKSRYQFSSMSATIEENTYSYFWDFGDGETSNAKNPVHNYTKNGEFQVQLVISNGVSSSSFQTFVLVNLVNRLSLDRDPKFCIGDSVVVTARGAYTYKWSNGSVENKICIKDVGTYSVIGTSITGCKDTLYFHTSTYDLLTYSIFTETEDKVAENTEVPLWTENVPYSSYHWDFGDGSTDEGNRVIHKFKNNLLGYYDVRLTATNPNGCNEYASKRIWVKTPVEMPNTFTPNGDGINDLLLKGWQVKIYNRNGIVLYEGNEGWDGTYNGQQVSPGVYYYLIYYPTAGGVKTDSGYVRVVR